MDRAPRPDRGPRRRSSPGAPGLGGDGPDIEVRRGVRLTRRDIQLVQWIGRHGVVTPQQVADRFFAREAGAPGQRAAYRRIAALADLGLLRRDWIVFNAPQVIRLTRPGSQLADVGLEPANLVIAEVPHAIRVVTLTERVLAEHPDWQLVTERELRADRYRKRRAGIVASGRIPDGLFNTPSGRRIALEVDETSKRSRDVESIIDDYRYGDEQYDRILWYAPAGRVAARIRQITQDTQAVDLIEVHEWRP